MVTGAEAADRSIPGTTKQHRLEENIGARYPEKLEAMT